MRRIEFLSRRSRKDLHTVIARRKQRSTEYINKHVISEAQLLHWSSIAIIKGANTIRVASMFHTTDNQQTNIDDKYED